jgi:hypothetical protein
MKSRVSRARRELLRILEDDLLADKRRDMPAMAGYIGGMLERRHTASLAARAQSSDISARIDTRAEGEI